MCDLTEAEQKLVGACLNAAAKGPFFDEWEFESLFGMTRSHLREVAGAWPEVDDTEEIVRLAINNSFTNLLGYPHRMDDNLLEWVGATREEINHVFEKWRSGSAG
jgi:hypothetical protein